MAGFHPVLAPGKTVRHTKARFKLLDRIAGVKRRRKGVEFFAGLSTTTFFNFKKRNPVEARIHEDNPRKDPTDPDS
jgi:hypothetical protein